MKVQKRLYSMLLACVMLITSICTPVQASFYEDEGVEVVFDEMDGDETIINDIVESANDDGNYDIIYDHEVDDTYDETWDGSEDIEPDDGQFIIEDFNVDAAEIIDEEDEYFEELPEIENDADLVGVQDNHLVAYPAGSETNEAGIYPLSVTLSVSIQEEVTLSVVASADDMTNIHYQWYTEDQQRIPYETSSSYRLIATVSTEYSCDVTDGYGNVIVVSFYINVLNKGYSFETACPLKENEECEFQDAYEYYFEFVPSESHKYVFYSVNSSDEDFSVEIYDADQNHYSHDGSEPANNEVAFARQMYLEEGKRYYFVLKRKSEPGSCRVNIKKSDFSATWASQDYTMDYSELHSVTFSVEAHSSSEIFYQWREERSEEILSTTDSCTFTPTKQGQYFVDCLVSDGFLRKLIGFVCFVTRNHLVAYPKGNKADADGNYSKTRRYTPIFKENIALTTIANADDTTELQYTWYKFHRSYICKEFEKDSGRYELIKNHGTNTIEILADEETDYKCVVNDPYDNYVTCYFEIRPRFIQKIDVTNKSIIAVGKSTALKVTGAVGNVTYKSSNPAIATVTSKGAVKGLKPGSVTITVNVDGWYRYGGFISVGPTSKTVKIAVVPAATTSLTATNLSKGIKLSWKKVTGATGYLIYRNNKLVKTINSGSTVTFTDTAANANGTKYVYKVVAKASTGNSTLSKSVTTYRVSRPAISSVSNNKSKTMTVKWGKNVKATGYQIQYSTSSSFANGNKTATISSNGTVSKAVGSLVKGKTYYVRIRSYKTVSGKKYFSTWSAKKIVKITK